MATAQPGGSGAGPGDCAPIDRGCAMSVVVGLEFDQAAGSVLLVVTDGERLAEFRVVEPSRRGKGLCLATALIGGDRWTLRIDSLGRCSLFRPTGHPLDDPEELLDRYGRLLGVGRV